MKGENMSLRFALIPVLFLGRIGATVAMEATDKVKREIAQSRCYLSNKDMVYVCEEDDPKFMDILKTYKEHGYSCEVISNKQYIYNHVLQDARDEYTLHGLPFQPREFWEKPMPEQLKHLKDAILELKLPEIAPNFHQNMGRHTDNKTFIGCGKALYPRSLEEKFEKAVWNILSKDYKISFDDFTTSLRSALKPGDRLYTAPLIMHFTNKLVPKYEFYYKNSSCEPYKTLKYPSEFELAIGVPNVGKVVYERKE